MVRGILIFVCFYAGCVALCKLSDRFWIFLVDEAVRRHHD